MHPDGANRQLLYTFTDSQFGWMQLTPDQNALLVFHQETVRGVEYARLTQIQIEDGAATILPEGEFLNFLPVAKTAWAGIGWFFIGLMFTMIPILLGMSQQFRSRTEEKTTEQPMFWIAPYKISIWPIWTDYPQA